jgi:pimeloyl-ACP methyl ester carboxylesterase
MVNPSSSMRLMLPYEVQSHLPLLVFVPGMDGTGNLYGKQADQLRHHFDIRCLTIARDDRHDWESLSDQLITLLQAEQYFCSRPVYLCGESFGGCLALKVATKHPALIERLILINPASWGIGVSQWIPDFLHRSAALVLLPFMASLNRISAGDRLILLKAMQSVPPNTISWRLSLLKSFCLESSCLAKITQPVLVVVSQGDRLLPSLEEGKNLVEKLPNAQIQVLSGSGHVCLLESDINLKHILEACDFLPFLQTC